jgi:Glucose / Sorbosone dehydrogenase
MLVIALAGGLLLIVGGGAGVVGVCKLTSVECYYLLHGDPLEQTSGTISLADGFSTEVVASGLDLPTAFDFLPDGRILVGEKKGLVRLIEDGEVASTPVLDLREKVNSALYRGLMAVAVDPDFDQNRFVYVVYSARREGVDSKKATYVVVSRFVLSGASAGGERVILGSDGQKTGDCAKLPATADCLPSDVDHIGADIAFARDGTLFVSTGDGGGHERVEETAFSAQDVDSLAGKILRVTRDGRGLASNFVIHSDSPLPQGRTCPSSETSAGGPRMRSTWHPPGPIWGGRASRVARGRRSTAKRTAASRCTPMWTRPSSRSSRSLRKASTR